MKGLFDSLRGAGCFIAIIALFLLVAVVLKAAVSGGVGIVLKLEPVVRFLQTAAFLALLPLIVLTLLPSTRGLAAIGLLGCSYVFGASAWMFSLVVAYTYWGSFAVVLGIFILGVGVVPIAALAALFNGAWVHLGSILLGVALAFGLRALALKLSE